MAKSFLLNMRLDPELIDIVDEFAHDTDSTRSDWIRAAIVTRLFSECGNDLEKLRKLVKRLKHTSTFRHVPNQMIAFFENLTEDQVEQFDEMKAKDLPGEMLAQMSSSEDHGNTE